VRGGIENELVADSYQLEAVILNFPLTAKQLSQHPRQRPKVPYRAPVVPCSNLIRLVDKPHRRAPARVGSQNIDLEIIAYQNRSMGLQAKIVQNLCEEFGGRFFVPDFPEAVDAIQERSKAHHFQSCPDLILT
jgi:hypothetical protein